LGYAGGAEALRTFRTLDRVVKDLRTKGTKELRGHLARKSQSVEA